MLTLIEELPERRWGKKVALYQCDCGKVVKTLMTYVRNGTYSCSPGCAHKGVPKPSLRSPHSRLTRDSYRSMIARCYNPKTNQYDIYGGAGVKVCERWLESIDNFVEDMGERPAKEYTIHRLDDAKDYEPGNCVWADKFVQNNEKSNVIKITWNGKTQSVAQWARELGIKYCTLHSRLRKMPLEEAFTMGVTKNRNRSPDFLKPVA